MTGTYSHDALDMAIRAVAERLRLRPEAARSWHDFTEEDLWYELASCILGSAVSFEQALGAAKRLKAYGLLALPADLQALTSYERRVAVVLSGSCGGTGYRFPHLRAQHLRRTAQGIYLNGSSLRSLLRTAVNPATARAQLISAAVGVGPKQASLFLRNIGFGDFAVLDRHVLRFMIWRGLLPGEVLLNTVARYERVEHTFALYASFMCISVVHLDIAAWIVIRALKDEPS